MLRRLASPFVVVGFAAGFGAAASIAVAGCSTLTVDCSALCARTLACEVTFAPADDPDGLKIVAGERTDAESCALGCKESPVVTVEHAACVDSLTITGDAAACQDDVLTCLELPTE